jgi:hypothetical protein
MALALVCIPAEFSAIYLQDNQSTFKGGITSLEAPELLRRMFECYVIEKY